MSRMEVLSVNINDCAPPFFAQSREMTDKYRRAFRLTDRDNVQIIVVPKGKAGKRAGSYIYQTMSARALRLQAKVFEFRRKIKEMESSDAPSGEKVKRTNALRCQLKYTESKLNAEIASSPRAGYIVVEDEEEQ